MNCSREEGRRLLRRLAKRLWRELRLGGRGSPGSGGSSASRPAAKGEEEEDDAYLYILLIMIFYGCLAGGLILAYTRSRKLESKHDPYHLYIESDCWAEGGPPGGSAGRGAPPPVVTVEQLRQQQQQPSGFEEEEEEEGAAAAAGGASPRDRRGSGDSEPL